MGENFRFGYDRALDSDFTLKAPDTRTAFFEYRLYPKDVARFDRLSKPNFVYSEENDRKAAPIWALSCAIYG